MGWKQENEGKQILQLLGMQYLSKQKYLILRIYTIKISSKKILMSENKRFTRSSALRLRNSNRQISKQGEEHELISRITKLINTKSYEQALQLIKSASPQTHQLECKRALVLFQLNNNSRSLNAVRKALKFDRNNCYHCYQLLLKIIQKNRPEIRPFAKDIESGVSCENLPKRVKSLFESLKSEIDREQKQPSTARQKFQQLTAYYQNKGLLFKKVEIVQIDEEYRVARAKSMIKANQVIIFVPQKQMITLQMAKSLNQVNRLSAIEQKLKSPKHCVLSIFLLIHMELGEESPYYNYIQCLPRKLNNFPIYYSDDLFEELSGTYFLTIIKRKKADIEQDYQQVISVLPQLKQVITYEKFIWARMVVCSRIFGVTINNKKTDALVPIADMLNHKIPKMTSWYFCDIKKGFVVQNASQQIPKGHQIFDSYGSKCNSRFLLNYGFTLPQNSFNEVVNVIITQVIKIKKFRNSKISTPNIKLTTSIGTDQFKILLAYYRKAVSEINKHGSNTEQQQNKSTNFISNENQCEVWRLIYETMKDQLHEYKTTIKIDQKILRSSEPLPFNLKNCVEIRLGEKIVLDFYVRMANKMINYFSRKRSNIDISQYETYLREIHSTLQVPSS